jgi:hypothetical protein
MLLHQVDPKNNKDFMDWLIPKYVAEIRSFVGIIGYYWRFRKGFSKIAYPITSL